MLDLTWQGEITDLEDLVDAASSCREDGLDALAARFGLFGDAALDQGSRGVHGNLAREEEVWANVHCLGLRMRSALIREIDLDNFDGRALLAWKALCDVGLVAPIGNTFAVCFQSWLFSNGKQKGDLTYGPTAMHERSVVRFLAR